MARRRSNQEGSVYKRSSGSWLAQVSIQGRRISKSFPTQREARAWIKRMQEQIECGLSVSGARITVGEYLELWLENTRSTLRPKTWIQYQGIVRNHLTPALGEIRLNDLQPQQIHSLYNHKMANGISRRTTKLIHSVLHRALVMAQRQGLIIRNPSQVVEVPRVIRHEMVVLDDTQVRQFLITARGRRLETLYHLAFTTGMRQGELLGLMWKDIDWAGCVIHVSRQLQRIRNQGLKFVEPKTQSGNRLIQFGPETLRQLMEHRRRQDQERAHGKWQDLDMVFASTIGTPMDLRNIHRDFKDILHDAGLPNMRFHDMRHTAATLMLLHGIPLLVVSRRLGHAKPSITLDIYGHYLPGMQGMAASLMDELVTPSTAQLQQNCSSGSSTGEMIEDLTEYVAVNRVEHATY